MGFQMAHIYITRKMVKYMKKRREEEKDVLGVCI
jgi:hypothetical protein